MTTATPRTGTPTTTKSYPVFDCDAHINDPAQIWDRLSKKEQEIVGPWYWLEGSPMNTYGTRLKPMYSKFSGPQINDPGRVKLVEIAGPGVDRATIRKLREMSPLTPEQARYVNRPGASDAKARIADSDLQGIDQVMVIPFGMFGGFLFVENHQAAALVARAYNDWVYDWCSEDPTRLFPAAALPVQDPIFAAAEVRRVAKLGFRAALVRPVDVRRGYPNLATFDSLWQAFDETGIVCGMHSMIAGESVPTELDPSVPQWSPSFFQERVLDKRQQQSEGAVSQNLGFIHEAMVWLTNVLLSGFMERYPGVKMATMESNAGWLPMLLEDCDKAVKRYKSERNIPVTRLPSEIYMEKGFIAFEGDESLVYQQHEFFENIGIWSSDVYHADGADAWTAIRKMNENGVPEEVQAKLMGGNARRMYGVEPVMCIAAEPEDYNRPDWFPKAEDLEREYAPLTERR